ncbi:HigA family addiction module antitoxin [Xanthomonas arboricola pv. corylina]|uniref:HigA family addiction module antitoxin n=1 Tax=Xanthomonas arboricola TaxID=56448 RepID=UPI004040BE31
MGRTAIHPGEHLAERLEALDLSAAELGRQLKVPGNRISQIITGHRAITGDTALRLGHFFGSSPQFWLSLQATYDLRVAEEKIGATIRNLPTLSGRQKGKTADHTSAI